MEQDKITRIHQLNEIMLHIQRAFQSGDNTNLLKAKSLLDGFCVTDSTVDLIRVDDVKLEEKQFITVSEKWVNNAFGGGFRKGELVLIGAPPKNGKTHTTIYLSSLLIKNGFTVLHFNGEDLISDIVNMYSQNLTEEHEKQLFIADIDSNFSLNTIQSSIKKLNKPFDVLVVDNIDIMQSTTSAQDWKEVGDITRGLKFLAKEHNCIIFAPSQISFLNNISKGLGRLYRGKVGKASNADIIWLLDLGDDNELYLEVAAARGRRVINRELIVKVDFGRMIYEPI